MSMDAQAEISGKDSPEHQSLMTGGDGTMPGLHYVEPDVGIEMPSYGDVVDNFDKVFQTYSNTMMPESSPNWPPAAVVDNFSEAGTKLGDAMTNQFPATVQTMTEGLANFAGSMNSLDAIAGNLQNLVSSFQSLTMEHTYNVSGGLDILGIDAKVIADLVVGNLHDKVATMIDNAIKDWRNDQSMNATGP